ncbi:TIGR01212 family radical SAM protein [Mangrovibacillus cuniculi]|uniref:TIGR01212 family radical SAM protein n=1 Tax=Mangrovibacillus cuniculi TaxID=2593652 RepID=A0A7S8CC59_9BACI|nr:TIGR01212 family radical SAM protein [Mangrovibacillus cuniculi]QPC47290.1 TIGR01212 family radical SAM protein [Mangrovibacillus cuniculi]
MTNQISLPFDIKEQRFYSWNTQLKEHFGQKIIKVSLDGGFDCPNRDGTVAHGGCTFCSAAGSGDFAGNRVEPPPVQFQKGVEKMSSKWKSGKYIAYFQAFTNTHAPVGVLRERFESVLTLDGVVGISIATRPDCLPDDVLDYLEELHHRTYLWVELGLQTIHERTALLINRAHDLKTYDKGVQALRKRGIRVCTHLINGLPLENYNMMMETAQYVADQDIQGVKLHLLHLLKGTPMVKQYEKGLVEFMSQQDYIELICDQLEILPSSVTIHRITGDGPLSLMVGPMWSSDKWSVLNGINQELRNRDSWQGKKVRG